MRALIVAAALALAACTAPQVKSPQDVINEANVTLTATANVIAQNVRDGVMTRPEASAALEKVRVYAAHVDQAQRLLREGQAAAALERAELAERLLLALHREVAARARRTP